jgi:hypothetical protein
VKSDASRRKDFVLLVEDGGDHEEQLIEQKLLRFPTIRARGLCQNGKWWNKWFRRIRDHLC